MHRVGVAEEVVQVAEDLLVGADQEDAEVVVVVVERVQLEHVLHVAQVDEVVDLAVGVAGDVGQHARRVGSSFEPVDRHDREELVDRPGVGQRLEHREVAEVGVRRAASRAPRAPRAPRRSSRTIRRIFWQIAQKMSSASTALSQRQVAER